MCSFLALKRNSNVWQSKLLSFMTVQKVRTTQWIIHSRYQIHALLKVKYSTARVVLLKTLVVDGCAGGLNFVQTSTKHKCIMGIMSIKSYSCIIKQQ